MNSFVFFESTIYMHYTKENTHIHDVFTTRYGLNSHCFHIIWDGHQPNSRGLYIPIGKDFLLRVR